MLNYLQNANHSSQGLNDTGVLMKESVAYTTFYAVLCAIISFLTITGNALLFYTVLKTTRLRTATNSLLLSLATADLVGGGIMIPLYIHQFTNRHANDDNSEDLCLVRKFLFLLTSGASITSLAVVSVDRMVAVSYPFVYARRMNARVVTTIIIAVWSICVSLTSVAVFVPIESWASILQRCDPGIPRASYLIVTPTSFYLPGVAILISYIKIFSIARGHRRKITTTQEPSVQPRASQIAELSNAGHREGSSTIAFEGKSTVSSKRSTITRVRRFTKMRSTLATDLKAAKTVSILVGLFLVCWSPVAFFYIYLNTTGVDVASSMKYTYIHDAFMLLSFLNSAIDPLLYTMLNKEIKSNMKRHIKAIISRGS
eukprot:gene3775-4298_t